MEDYRQPWESDEHWNIRKEFLETYKDDFPEDRLLCLAQVYSNIELLGCSYPEPVMRQVRELSKNLYGPQRLEENRKAKAMKFIKESQTSSNSFSSGSKHKSESTEMSSKKIKYSHNSDSHLNNFLSSDELNQKNVNENSNSMKADENNTSKNTILQIVTSKDMALICESGKMIKKYIDKNLSPISAFHSFKQKFNFRHDGARFEIEIDPLSSKNNPIFHGKFYLKNILISSCTENTKKKAKLKTAEHAVDILMNSNNYFCVNNEVNNEALNKTSQILSSSSNSLYPQFSSLINENNHSYNIKNLTNSLNSKEDQVEQLNSKDQTKPINSALVKCNNLQSTFAIDKFLNQLKHQFVIIDYSELSPKTPISILMESASFCHKSITFNFRQISSLIRCDVNFQDRLIGSGEHMLKHEAKSLAAIVALKNLQKIFYTVKVKNLHAAGFIVHPNQVCDITGSSNPISDDNIGSKMLKMMGWKGGAIGKIGSSGILEPIEIENNKHGRGFGYVNKKCNFQDFNKRLQALIQDYARSSTVCDLIFSKEFSVDERKQIHNIATRYHLKHVSHGKGNDRYITLSHKFTAKQLIKCLLNSDIPNYKYEIVYPT